MLDRVDMAILKQLRADGRLSMRRLGERVHLTAPAVAERVRRLEERGIIARYTIEIDRSKFEPVLLAFVDVIMQSNDHARFLQFLQTRAEVREWHRISGDCCYMLRVETSDRAVLERFLDELLRYANYRLNLVLSSGQQDALLDRGE